MNTEEPRPSVSGILWYLVLNVSRDETSSLSLHPVPEFNIRFLYTWHSKLSFDSEQAGSGLRLRSGGRRLNHFYELSAPLEFFLLITFKDAAPLLSLMFVASQNFAAVDVLSHNCVRITTVPVFNKMMTMIKEDEEDNQPVQST